MKVLTFGSLVIIEYIYLLLFFTTTFSVNSVQSSEVVNSMNTGSCNNDNINNDGNCGNNVVETNEDGYRQSIEDLEAIIPIGANEIGAPRVAMAECVDRYEDCAQYAEQGDCHAAPGWMIMYCPKSCNTCELRDPKIRCPRSALNMSTEPIYKPGDMEQMFGSIQSRFDGIYDVNVLSTSPWVITLDNFLTNEEADALITTVERWERSTDSGTTNEFGETGRVLSSGRTSSNAWCQFECEKHPLVQNIFRKIEQVTNVPKVNYESFQVLRYDIGQFYQTHHDYGSEDVSLAC
eukprot:gene13151-17619_t